MHPIIQVILYHLEGGSGPAGTVDLETWWKHKKEGPVDLRYENEQIYVLDDGTILIIDEEGNWYIILVEVTIVGKAGGGPKSKGGEHIVGPNGQGPGIPGGKYDGQINIGDFLLYRVNTGMKKGFEALMKGFQRLARIVKEGWSGNEPTPEPEVPDEPKIISIDTTFETKVIEKIITIGPSDEIIGAWTKMRITDTINVMNIDTTFGK